MKYSITQYYSKTVEVDADSPEKAYQTACETYAFDEVDEVACDMHDVEPVDD